MHASQPSFDGGAGGVGVGTGVGFGGIVGGVGGVGATHDILHSDMVDHNPLPIAAWHL